MPGGNWVLDGILVLVVAIVLVVGVAVSYFLLWNIVKWWNGD